MARRRGRIQGTQESATQGAYQERAELLVSGCKTNSEAASANSEEILSKLKSLRVSSTGAKVKAVVKKKVISESMTDNLRLLLERGWEKWNNAIDDFLGDSTSAKLHAVRIKAKTLRYSIDLSQRFYPDNHLDNASGWLKTIQDRIGAWHDEFMLGQRALETFSDTPRDPIALKVIREIKEKEIAMGESARDFLSAIGKTKQYQRLQLVMSATVYAMANGSDPGKLANESIRGPLP